MSLNDSFPIVQKYTSKRDTSAHQDSYKTGPIQSDDRSGICLVIKRVPIKGISVSMPMPNKRLCILKMVTDGQLFAAVFNHDYSNISNLSEGHPGVCQSIPTSVLSFFWWKSRLSSNGDTLFELFRLSCTSIDRVRRTPRVRVQLI